MARNPNEPPNRLTAGDGVADDPEAQAALMTLVARLVNKGLAVEQFDLRGLVHEGLALGDFEIRVVKLD